MKTFDCFPFFNELDLLDLRLRHLSNVIDKFIIVEGEYSHQGRKKKLYFDENKSQFKKYENKIIHIIRDNYPKHLGDTHSDFILDYYTRNGIDEGLKGKGDTVMVVDSINSTINTSVSWSKKPEKLCDEVAIIHEGLIIKQGDTSSIIKEVSLNTIELELENLENLNLSSNLKYTVENSILKLQSKNVNKDMVEIIRQIEKTTTIKNINIIKGSLEDAFLKLTN